MTGGLGGGDSATGGFVLEGCFCAEDPRVGARFEVEAGRGRGRGVAGAAFGGAGFRGGDAGFLLPVMISISRRV